MTDTLSDTTIHLVKATVPALLEHGLAITKRMYERMFRNEEIRDLFNQSHHGETGSQRFSSSRFSSAISWCGR